MDRPTTRMILLAALAGCLGIALAGCGGSAPDSVFELTGNVSSIAPARGPAETPYEPVMDYMVYAADPVTHEKVCTEVRTDYTGLFRIRNVPSHGDLMIMAERDGVTLQAFVTEQARTDNPHCQVTPDSTVAASTTQQLRSLSIPDDILYEVYTNCLSYQSAHRFDYGGHGGVPCDLTSASAVATTGRQLLRASVDETIGLALDNRDLPHCTRMVSAAICEVALNNGCTWRLTAEQRTKLAQRTTTGDIWTPAEAAALIANAGITTFAALPVSAADVTFARERLITKVPSLGEGIRPKICATELLMICCQNNDGAVSFRVLNQNQLNNLVALMVGETI